MCDTLVLERLHLVCVVVLDLNGNLHLFGQAVLFVVDELDVLLIDFKVIKARVFVAAACCRCLLLGGLFFSLWLAELVKNGRQ